ncbi:TlpA family protein disulfide reductase [Zunongwangia sp.]|uniref:TlpA family protein disulfide reductase n=1 Tax=Zunongwangia sp. TaxID=1965325 RepID=UPI003AA84DA1
MKLFSILKIIPVFTLLLFSNTFTGKLWGQNQDEIFNVEPRYPKGGDRVTLSYDASQTPLKDADSLTAIVYTYADFQWNVKDLNLERTDKNIWQGQLKLEPGIALINCVFYAKDMIDRGGANTYTWMINKAPGSYSGWGIIRNPHINEDFPQQLDSLSFIEDSVTLMWLNNEMRDNPSSRSHIFYPGLRLLKRTKAEDQTGRIKEELNYILSLPSLNISQQYDVQRSLDLITGNEDYVDSIQEVLLSKYPNGVLARDRALKKLFREADFKERVEDYNRFLKQFPKEKFKEISSTVEELYYDKLYRSIAYTYIVNNKDYSFVFDNLKNASYTNLVDYAWHLVSIPYNNESMSLDSLQLFANRIFPEMELRENEIPKAYHGKISKNQWKAMALKIASSEYLTYAKILNNQHNYKREAYYLDKIEELLKYKNTEYNELYTQRLVRQNKTDKAVKFITLCLRQNNTSPAMLQVLKNQYLKAGHPEADFDEYVELLKEGKENQKEKETLLTELIKKPIEDFSLESSHGGMVNLKDQLGKIVVIDMWATWCAPCKKAMPGMKMAVNHYTEDSDVKFYFLDTQEYVKDYKSKTAAFIKEKGYPFEVLYDAVNPETGKPDAIYAKYAKAFQFSGIPQKLIIDQNGFLRWRSTGYEGSPSALADEIKTIIEYLKTESKS